VLIGDQVADIIFSAGKEIVEAHNIVAFFKQPVTQM
jgi:hypothetical protein